MGEDSTPYKPSAVTKGRFALRTENKEDKSPANAIQL